MFRGRDDQYKICSQEQFEKGKVFTVTSKWSNKVRSECLNTMADLSLGNFGITRKKKEKKDKIE